MANLEQPHAAADVEPKLAVSIHVRLAPGILPRSVCGIDHASFIAYLPAHVISGPFMASTKICELREVVTFSLTVLIEANFIHPEFESYICFLEGECTMGLRAFVGDSGGIQIDEERDIGDIALLYEWDGIVTATEGIQLFCEIGAVKVAETYAGFMKAVLLEGSEGEGGRDDGAGCFNSVSYEQEARLCDAGDVGFRRGLQRGYMAG